MLRFNQNQMGIHLNRIHTQSTNTHCVVHLSQVAEGESRVTSLQREVDRLSQALSKVHEGEACLREKTQNLSQSLQEATAAHSATQGRLVALQKTLGLAEQDRRHLQVGGEEPLMGQYG